MAEFLENVLAFFSKQELVSYQQPLAEEWGFLCVFNQKSKFFVVKKNSGLHKRKLLKSVKKKRIIIISKGYHFVTSLGILAIFILV